MSFRIDLTTGLVSVQGAPRPGLRKFGVPPGGPFDTESARHANLLLGNDAFDPVLEMALVNGDLTFERRMTFALVGSGHRAELDGQVVELCGSYEVQAGSMLKVFPVAHGLRCYLAVPGGIRTTTALASFEARSESLSREPQRLSTPLQSLKGGPFRVVIQGSFPVRTATVTARIDRVGLRLDAPGVGQGTQSETSRPMVLGAVQRAPSGGLLIHGPDGPTIGGYELLGVVAMVDQDRLAQLRPGQTVEFVQITAQEARALRAQR